MSTRGRYLASWSGGKDSCFACYKAKQEGLQIAHLVHFERPFDLHGVGSGLLAIQAAHAGIPLVNRRVANEDFEREFRSTVRGLAASGDVRGMIFGDIHLEEHRKWVEGVCAELGIEAVLPLWGRNTASIVREFLDEGFEAIVVSGREHHIGREWIGRKLDRSFLEYLRMRRLDPCGENGEYHTFVISGPLFNGQLSLSGKGSFRKNGHWFLDLEGSSTHEGNEEVISEAL